MNEKVKTNKCNQFGKPRADIPMSIIKKAKIAKDILDNKISTTSSIKAGQLVKY